MESETRSITWFPATKEQKNLQNQQLESDKNRGQELEPKLKKRATQRSSRQVDQTLQNISFPQRLVN